MGGNEAAASLSLHFRCSCEQHGLTAFPFPSTLLSRVQPCAHLRILITLEGKHSVWLR